MPNEAHDPLIIRMQRQLRVLWLATGLLTLLAIAGFVVFGYLFAIGRKVPISGDVTSLHVLTSKPGGDSLILTSEGLSIVDAAGKTIAQLHDVPDYGPELIFNHWQSELDLNKFVKTGKLKSEPPRVTSTMRISASDLAISNGGQSNMSLEMADGNGALYISSGENQTSVSTNGVSIWRDCGTTEPTCYTSRMTLSTALGFNIESCEKHLGDPINKKNKDQGCSSLWAVARGFSGEGANISLLEDGLPRLILGGAVLTSKQVGGTVITPISQLTAFDKKGKVIWKIPQY